jgi:hypothetical protein
MVSIYVYVLYAPEGHAKALQANASVGMLVISES